MAARILALYFTGCTSTDFYKKRNHLLTGYSFEMQDLKQKALSEYQKAVIEQPENAIAWTNLGNIYSKIGEKEKAIESYKQAIEINNNCSEAINNLACIYLDNNENLDEALELVNKAITLKPEEIWFYYDTLGWTYFKRKEYQNAKKNVEQAINVCQQDQEEFLSIAYYHLALICFESGNKSKALEHYNKALKLSNDEILNSIINTNIKLIAGR